MQVLFQGRHTCTHRPGQHLPPHQRVQDSAIMNFAAALERSKSQSKSTPAVGMQMKKALITERRSVITHLHQTNAAADLMIKVPVFGCRARSDRQQAAITADRPLKTRRHYSS